MTLALTTDWHQSRHLIQQFAGIKKEDSDTVDLEFMEAVVKVFQTAYVIPE